MNRSVLNSKSDSTVVFEPETIDYVDSDYVYL